MFTELFHFKVINGIRYRLNIEVAEALVCLNDNVTSTTEQCPVDMNSVSYWWALFRLCKNRVHRQMCGWLKWWLPVHLLWPTLLRVLQYKGQFSQHRVWYALMYSGIYYIMIQTYIHISYNTSNTYNMEQRTLQNFLKECKRRAQR